MLLYLLTWAYSSAGIIGVTVTCGLPTTDDDDLLIVLTETKTSLRLYTRPSGTPPPGKKVSKCDDAPAMTLVVQWWLSCRLIPVAELYFSVG